MVIDWVGFIETARKNSWWDFQTYKLLVHALADAQIAPDKQKGSLDRFKLYVLKNPHPRMR